MILVFTAVDLVPSATVVHTSGASSKRFAANLRHPKSQASFDVPKSFESFFDYGRFFSGILIAFSLIQGFADADLNGILAIKAGSKSSSNTRPRLREMPGVTFPAAVIQARLPTTR
jgi:hypothetical protein